MYVFPLPPPATILVPVLSDAKACQKRAPADCLSTQVTPESDDMYKYPAVAPTPATILVPVLSDVKQHKEWDVADATAAPDGTAH